MSFLAGGIKDLQDDPPATTRRAPRPKPTAKVTGGHDGAATALSKAQTPKGLGFNPLKPTERQIAPQEPATSTSEPPQESSATKQDTDALVANITALFSELGASTSQEEENPETNDVTESLLHALNHAVDEGDADIDLNDDMNPELVGKVLAENVMKQILMKSTLYEPLKDLKENYVLWLSSDAADSISAEERQRHEDLIASLEELIHVYDTDPDNMPRIMALFAKSQSLGSPPEAVYESLTDYDASNGDDPNKEIPQCFQQTSPTVECTDRSAIENPQIRVLATEPVLSAGNLVKATSKGMSAKEMDSGEITLGGSEEISFNRSHNDAPQMESINGAKTTMIKNNSQLPTNSTSVDDTPMTFRKGNTNDQRNQTTTTTTNPSAPQSGPAFEQRLQAPQSEPVQPSQQARPPEHIVQGLVDPNRRGRQQHRQQQLDSLEHFSQDIQNYRKQMLKRAESYGYTPITKSEEDRTRKPAVRDDSVVLELTP